MLSFFLTILNLNSFHYLGIGFVNPNDKRFKPGPYKEMSFVKLKEKFNPLIDEFFNKITNTSFEKFVTGVLIDDHGVKIQINPTISYREYKKFKKEITALSKDIRTELAGPIRFN